MKTALLKLKVEKDVRIDWLLNDINTEYESLLIANELKLPTDDEIYSKSAELSIDSKGRAHPYTAKQIRAFADWFLSILK